MLSKTESFNHRNAFKIKSRSYPGGFLSVNRLKELVVKTQKNRLKHTKTRKILKLNVIFYHFPRRVTVTLLDKLFDVG